MHNSKPTRTNKEAKTGQIIRIEQDQLHKHLDKVVRGTVEQTLNRAIGCRGRPAVPGIAI
jgi:hypothetical protein